MASTMAIDALPNEILSGILSSFGTKALLPITLTSRRFYNIIVQIIHNRLLNVSAVEDHKLILECSHPSSRAFTPYFFVDTLGIGTCDGIDNDPRIVSFDGGTHHLGKLRELYSHFRPMLSSEVHQTRRERAGSWGFDQSNSLSEMQTDLVCQDIFLEPHEFFSQLCTLTKLIRQGLRPGSFTGWVDIGGGVIRVWRDWLAEQCGSLKPSPPSIEHSSNIIQEEGSGESLLWADPRENIGLRIRVSKREETPLAALAGPNEETSVSYMLQYEELVIRSAQLLFALEKSNELQSKSSNKGVLIGSWNRGLFY